MTTRTNRDGSRAINWSLSSFDKIGSANTLSKVWARLKGNHQDRVLKRDSFPDGRTDHGKKTKGCAQIEKECGSTEDIRRDET